MISPVTTDSNFKADIDWQKAKQGMRNELSISQELLKKSPEFLKANDQAHMPAEA